MILDIGEQANLFLLAFYIGIFSAILYDIFRVIRKVFAHKNYLVYIEDFLFWIIVTCCFYYIFLHKNNGEIRFYLLLGLFIGFLLFILTLSRFFRKYLEIIFRFCIKFFKKIITLLLQPLKILCKMVVRCLRPILIIIIKSLKKIKNKLSR